MTPTNTSVYDRTPRLLAVHLSINGHPVDTIDSVDTLANAVDLLRHVRPEYDITVRDRGLDILLAERVNGTWSPEDPR